MKSKLILVLLLLAGPLAFAQAPAGNVSNRVDVSPCSSTPCVPNPVVAVQVSTSTPFIPVAGKATFAAIAQLQDGSLNANVTSQCAWSSTNSAVATNVNQVFTGAGSGAVTVNAVCGNGSGAISGSAPLTVQGGPTITNPSCGIPPCPLPQGFNGTAYSFTFAGSPAGGTWAVTSGSIPAWASLNSSSGALTGTPNANGTTLFTIQYTNGSSNTLQVSLTVTAALPAIAALPTLWANNHECDAPGGTYDVTKTLGTDFPLTTAGLNSAISAWQAAPDQWWHVILPHGQLLPVTAQVTLLGKSGAIKCFVLDSDTPLTNNQTVCSHKIIDNNDGSSPRNLGCTNDISSMGTMEGQWSPGNNGLLLTACTLAGPNCSVAPNHYAFKNTEFRPQAGLTGPVNMIQLNDGDTSGTQGSSHIWFINDYLHADATDAGVATNQISAVFRWDGCTFCGRTYSYIDQIANIGSESHIDSLDWTPGPLKVVHNWDEGSSINWITGGAAATVTPAETVKNVEFRTNRQTKPAAWLPFPVGSPALVLKSDFELKTGQQILLDGDIFENSSTNGGQKGQCITLTPRNTSASLNGDNYTNAVQDITISNDICRNAVTVLESAGRSGQAGNGGGAAQPGRRWQVQNVLAYNISPGASSIYNNTVTIPFAYEVGDGGNTWTCSASASGITVTLTCADGGTGLHQTSMNPGDLVNVTSCANPNFNTPARKSTFVGKGPVALSGTLPLGLTVIYQAPLASGSTTGCILTNKQGFQESFSVRHTTTIGSFVGASKASGQVPSCLAVDAYPQNFTFVDNLIAVDPSHFGGTTCQGGGNTEGWTSENNMADTSTFAFHHLAIPGRTASNYAEFSGSPQVFTVNVTPSGSVTTAITSVFTVAAVPPSSPALNIATVASTVGFTVGSTITIAGVTPSGFNGTGTIFSVTDTTHLTWTPVQVEVGLSGTGGTITQLIPGTQVTNAGSGTFSTKWPNGLQVKVGTLPGQISSCTTTVCTLDSPVSNGAGQTMTVYAGINPPNTIWFPSTIQCSGAAADSTCVGFANMLNGAAYLPAAVLYTGYELDASSLFHAGNSQQASDGTDLGANIPGINSALVSTEYVCGSPCGSGPFPD